MPITIEMPKLSDTMTEGTLVRWIKKVGDKVEVGDVLAEVETDKATMEMEAFDEGTLGEVYVEDGQKAEVGQKLALLLEEGEEAPTNGKADKSVAAGAGPKKGGKDKAPEKQEPPSAEVKQANQEAEGERSEGLEASPMADKEEGEEKPASKTSEHATKPAAGTEPSAKAEPAAAQAEQQVQESAEEEGRVKASPLARKIARELGVELESLSGSGPGGRIVRDDVLAAAKTGSKPGRAEKPSPVPQPQPVAGKEDKRIPLSGMRKGIASRLLEAKTTIPHFYLQAEVNAAPLMQLRKEVNNSLEASGAQSKVTINDFILKATAVAATRVPQANAAFAGDAIIQFANVQLACAVAIDDGLVTPVIREAQRKSLLQISSEIKDLAARARSKKLKPEEYQGGTLTVSNLGSYGVEQFFAIINPPQSLIVSVGAVLKKPVVTERGDLAVGERVILGLSCDHRVVDGAIGAHFLTELKKLIEAPALMLI
jgi:pyruvate dehydrogenase E2 component (dihydrolipoamide acetyltransferase)